MTAETLNKFFESGRRDINALMSVFNTHFNNFKPEFALDFGCGVGRMTIPIAENIKSVIGVDISDDMLNEAKKNIQNFDYKNIELYKYIPDDIYYDWINSLIVFQHIPPQRGYYILQTLLEKLNSGGFISCQFTIFRDKNHLDEIFRDVECCKYDGNSIKILSKSNQIEGQMSMYEYDINYLLSILTTYGMNNFLMQHTNHGGCHGIILFSKKD
jgi:trans-aconitate methyltransferase